MSLIDDHKIIADIILGMNKDDAKQQLEAAGWLMRVAREDGQNMVGTCDFRPNRIVVEVENGIIVKCGDRSKTSMPQIVQQSSD